MKTVSCLSDYFSAFFPLIYLIFPIKFIKTVNEKVYKKTYLNT